MCLFQFPMFLRFPLSIERSNMKSIGSLKTEKLRVDSVAELVRLAEKAGIKPHGLGKE